MEVVTGEYTKEVIENVIYLFIFLKSGFFFSSSQN